MAINARGSMVFDLKTLQEQKKKEGNGPVLTYRLTETGMETASAEEPILVLRDEEGKLRHHTDGQFMNPSRRSGFAYSEEGTPGYADILLLDKRFEKLYRWLAGNQVHLRFSGAQTGEGYAVYKMHAVNLSGRIQSGTDSFLQLVIARLLQSHPEGEADPEFDEDEADGESELRLTDIGGMTDFLECAGASLPVPVLKWAQRNLTLIRQNTISQDERRHAQRALSMMLNIQWKSSYFASIDPVEARRILDEELYGMESVKQRIIETIIQINRTHTLPAYGILLAGPAGVGKSQVAYAVARILKLPWASLDMSTIHDPEAITGSPRVYANAKPGLIMEAFSRAGASNLVFIINELDKAESSDNGGNPADALLTLLDNLGYTDNYIECQIPTGGVYPIATANDKSRISAPLMSRFAVIDIPDYTPEEKRIIFSRFALPRTLKRMGMRPEECVVPEDAARAVVEQYEGLPGCRDLEQAAEHLAANALYQIETQKIDGVTFGVGDVRRILSM